MNIAVTRPLNSVNISGQITYSRYYFKNEKEYMSVKILQKQRYNDKVYFKTFNIFLIEPSEADKRKLYVGNYMFVTGGKLSFNDEGIHSIICSSQNVSTVYIENEQIKMPEIHQAIKQLKM